MRFCTLTLGCKANQFDTGVMEKLLLSRSHSLVRMGDGCDVCIINTCAVTSESVRKSRQAVRRARKLEPGALIAVCGCFSQLEHDAAVELGADIVGGTSDCKAFVEKIENEKWKMENDVLSLASCRGGILPPAGDCKSPLQTNQQTFSRTRALLKIQDGCDNHCAYCIIPQARGSSRSVSPANLAQMAREQAAQGYKEIVITGIEISSFEPSLIEAVRAVSFEAPNARLRLGSLNPDILTSDFTKQLRDIPNLCNHFHLSLQSGYDETLKRMGRSYTTRQVLDAISELRRTFDNCAVAADLIVGFPGEIDSEFEQTLSFIEKTAFSSMHIFPYSKRPGTAAANMPGQIDGKIKQQRAKQATQLAHKLSEQFKQAQVGKVFDVLFETQKTENGITTTQGHTTNYQLVSVPDKIKKNTIMPVKIIGIGGDGLNGIIKTIYN